MTDSMEEISDQNSVHLVEDENDDYSEIVEMEEYNEYDSFVNIREKQDLFENVNKISDISQIKKDHEEYSKTHQTTKFLTKYEITKIIGMRAQQLAAGAVPFVDVDPTTTDTIQIAYNELIERKIPYILKRRISTQKYEYWKIKDLGLRQGFLPNI